MSKLNEDVPLVMFRKRLDQIKFGRYLIDNGVLIKGEYQPHKAMYWCGKEDWTTDEASQRIWEGPFDQGDRYLEKQGIQVGRSVRSTLSFWADSSSTSRQYVTRQSRPVPVEFLLLPEVGWTVQDPVTWFRHTFKLWIVNHPVFQIRYGDGQLDTRITLDQKPLEMSVIMPDQTVMGKPMIHGTPGKEELTELTLFTLTSDHAIFDFIELTDEGKLYT